MVKSKFGKLSRSHRPMANPGQRLQNLSLNFIFPFLGLFWFAFSFSRSIFVQQIWDYRSIFGFVCGGFVWNCLKVNNFVI